jgi:hypothetical protein
MEWEQKQRWVGEGTKDADEKDQDGAAGESAAQKAEPQAAEPIQKMALLRHRLPLFLPSAKHLPHVAVTIW